MFHNSYLCVLSLQLTIDISVFLGGLPYQVERWLAARVALVLRVPVFREGLHLQGGARGRRAERRYVEHGARVVGCVLSYFKLGRVRHHDVGDSTW